MLNISLTGTFSVKRTALEEKIKSMEGFEVIDFSKQTEILLVGEKTASPAKIQKAKKLQVKIINGFYEETILEKLERIKYHQVRNRRDKEDDDNDEKTRLECVGLFHVNEVYIDFAGEMADAGEWHAQDIENFFESDQREDLVKWLKIIIKPEEEKDFWKVLRRLMILDYVSWEFCEYEDPIINVRELSQMTEEDFRKRILNLSLIKLNQDSRKGFLSSLREDNWEEEMNRIFELN